MTITRRTALTAAGSAMAAAAISTVPAFGKLRPTGTQPNFVHICVDDMRFDDYKYMTNLKNLIKAKSVVFTHHFLSYPVCAPSRCSTLLGQHAHNHGILGNAPPSGYAAFQYLEPNCLFTWLKGAGYHTGFTGKYINGYEDYPTHLPAGVDDWKAMSSVFTDYFNFTLNENGTQVSYTSGEYSTDVFGNNAVNFFANVPSGEPFFYFIWPNACHGPCTPSAQDAGTFSGVPMPQGPSYNVPITNEPPRLVRPPLTPTQLADDQSHWQLRQETLQSVDRMIGQIISALTASGQIANTHIIFTSDNGYMLAEHAIFKGKDDLYEESIRVPLYWLQPSGYSGSYGGATSNVDVTATICDLAGATPGVNQDGVSLAPQLLNTATNGRTCVPLLCQWSQGVATLNYRYVVWNKGDIELFDMKNDPNQMTNVAGQTAYATIQADLQAALTPLEVCVGPGCSYTSSFPPPP